SSSLPRPACLCSAIEEAIEGGELRDSLPLVVGRDGQKGALGGGDDGRRLIGQDNLALGGDYPCTGGDGARRDAGGGANRGGGGGGGLSPGGQHPPAPVRRRPSRAAVRLSVSSRRVARIPP